MTAVLVDPLASAPVDETGPPGHKTDDALFASMYRRFFSLVRSWTKALGGNNSDPDDIAQNVFVVVYRRLGEFDGNNVAGWLYRITVNQVRDHRRSAWARFRTCVDADTIEQIVSPSMTPARAVEVRRDLADVSHTLARLPIEARRAFVSFEIEGYTSKEIAKSHSTTTRSVYGRVRGARKAILAEASARYRDATVSSRRG